MKRRFRDTHRRAGHTDLVSGPNPARTAESDAHDDGATPDLVTELTEAVAAIERGDYIELTPEALDRCIVDGEWPWPDEFPD